MSFRLLAYTLILVTLSSGCAARQVSRDGKNFRQAVLDIYTDQVIDNLIRAKEGMPFVQLAYRDMLVQDTDSISGSLDNTYLDERTPATNAVGVLTGITRKISNTFKVGAAAKRDRILSFKADPITDRNDIYELYMAYASDPGLFVVSEQKPACPVHVMKKYDGRWYYVPKEAAFVFQRLVLETTFMRGGKTQAPAYYERQIVAVFQKPVKGQDEQAYIFQFDRPLPNGDGSIELDGRGGRSTRLGIRPVTAKPEGYLNDQGQVMDNIPRVNVGAQTMFLLSNWNPKEVPFKAEELAGRTARIYLTDFPPPSPKPSPELQRILDNLDQIRANVVRPLVPSP